MNENILKPDVQKYIGKNWNTDIMSILLKKPIFKDVTNKELAVQLQGKKKCRNKLPTWFGTPDIYYPDQLNIEQTSSETTAKYKAGLANGKSLIDLTGGLGIDSYYFSKTNDAVTHCEVYETLSRITAHNLKALQVKNVSPLAVNGIEYLKTCKKDFDHIYIDPSRRDATQRKVFLLSDCSPNVPLHIDLLLRRSENVLIKTSPLLDFSNGIKELKCVKEIHVVAVDNEVKELLWILRRDYEGEVAIKTINIKKNKSERFDFDLLEEKQAISTFSEPLAYLYEPNSAILKSGAFRLVAERSSIYKLQEHTHLYTSKALIAFPGRSFKIIGTFPYNKKAIKSLRFDKANISTRNFPESVSNIRKKTKIADGGDTYLFFCKDLNGKTIGIHAQKSEGP